MANEALKEEHERLKNQFYRLLACLYPNSIGLHDIDYIINGEKEEKANG